MSSISFVRSVPLHVQVQAVSALDGLYSFKVVHSAFPGSKRDPYFKEIEAITSLEAILAFEKGLSSYVAAYPRPLLLMTPKLRELFKSLGFRKVLTILENRDPSSGLDEDEFNMILLDKPFGLFLNDRHLLHGCTFAAIDFKNKYVQDLKGSVLFSA